jgi:hypothetical protein
MRVPEARNASVEYVENESCGRHGSRRVEVKQRSLSHVRHREKDTGRAARGIGKRQKVGKMKPPNHREMAARCRRRRGFDGHRFTFYRSYESGFSAIRRSSPFYRWRREIRDRGDCQRTRAS